MGDGPRDRPRGVDPDDQGGDAACWAHLICDDCGRVLEPGEPHDCSNADPAR